MRSGQRIGRYVLGELIAKGGMAEVWAARVEGPNGFVKSLALKFILESFAGDAELERLFINEARVAARLTHANLVGVFDFDKVPDPERGGLIRHYIAMERVDGADLRRVLQTARQKDRAVSVPVGLYVAGEVLKGLRYVHELREPTTSSPLGLVHRDVSPHNVLVGMGGEVKLSDFGIAKAKAQSLGTQTGMVRGKLAYASPEQLRGEAADHRSDQFALGITLWEVLAGRRLFGAVDEQQIIGKVLRCDVPPLSGDAGVGAPVEAIVRRMLSPLARDRFSSTAEALAAVLSAPGYVGDAVPLAGLMTALFAGRAAVLPPTLPLERPAAGPPPVAPFETKKLTPDRVAATAAAGSARSSDDALVEAWWEESPDLPVVRPSPHPPKADAVTARVDDADVVTGSAYVSAHHPDPPWWGDARAPSPWRRGVAWALALVALAAAVAGGGTLVVRLRARGAAGASGDQAVVPPPIAQPMGNAFAHGTPAVPSAAGVPVSTPEPAEEPAAPVAASPAIPVDASAVGSVPGSAMGPAAAIVVPESAPVQHTDSSVVRPPPPPVSGAGSVPAPNLLLGAAAPVIAPFAAPAATASAGGQSQATPAASPDRPGSQGKGVPANGAPILE